MGNSDELHITPDDRVEYELSFRIEDVGPSPKAHPMTTRHKRTQAVLPLVPSSVTPTPSIEELPNPISQHTSSETSTPPAPATKVNPDPLPGHRTDQLHNSIRDILAASDLPLVHLEHVLQVNGIFTIEDLKAAFGLASTGRMEQHDFWQPLLQARKISRLELFKLKQLTDRL
jgi:hypothetical protein